MNSEHLQDVDSRTWEERVRALEDEGLTRSDAQAVVDAEDMRQSHTGGRTATNGHLDEAEAVEMVLAAYDHVLFHPWRPGEEMAWSAALAELLGARARILAKIIPARLRSYRSWNVDKREVVA